MWGRAVSFVNGRVVTPDGVAAGLRFRARILSVDEPPRRGDHVVDLEGGIVLPGLINAHEHLELNHYGRLKFRQQYRNVSEWIDDMRPRLHTDPGICQGRAYPLADRLFIGVLKNLLAGVTTVAHHNPLYRELKRSLPIRVIRRYGWAHSFDLQQQPAGARGEPGGDVAARFRATPRGQPFIVHLGEGMDDAARAELSRLEALGCLASNVLVVHGVAIDAAGWRRMGRAGAGLVWCPGSNLFLFNRTAPVREFLAHVSESRRLGVALGTDSRLSGGHDLLDELRIAKGTRAASDEHLFAMVTREAADLLRLPDAGRIRTGAPADLVVLPPSAATPIGALLATARQQIRSVIVNGRPVVADERLKSVLAARRVRPAAIRVDGAARVADAWVARQIADCAITEPGVEAA